MRVLIAASGTGGHLIPAVTIARALLVKAAKVSFVGSGRYLESQIIDTHGFKRFIIDTVGIKNRGILGKLQFIFKLPKALFQTFSILNKFKPDLVIGVGGYISVLPILAAKVLGIKCIVHEAELLPGLANKILAKFVDCITTAHVETFANNPKSTFVGHILRQEIYEVPELESSEIKNILVMGGSQGSKSLDDTLPQLADIFKAHDLEIWHQCRKDSIEEVRHAYEAAGVKAKVECFIKHPEDAYRQCQLVIARSGAGTVQELNIVRRPSILVPLPVGKEQHHNAEFLLNQGKCLMVQEDHNLRQKLQEALLKMLDPDNFRKICANFKTSQPIEAASQIAEIANKLSSEIK